MNVDGTNIKGFATLEFIDAETNEVKRVVEGSNSMTQSLYAYLQGRHIYIDYAAYSDARAPGSSTPSAPILRSISGAVNWGMSRVALPSISSDIRSHKSYAMWSLPSNRVAPNTIESPWTVISTNDDLEDLNTPAEVISIRVRFNQPTVTRDINSIFLWPYGASDATSSPPATWIRLTTPCQQLTSEILDITYRIEIYNTQKSIHANTSDTIWFGPFNPAISKSKWWRYGSSYGAGFNEAYQAAWIQGNWFKKPSYTTDYNYVYSSSRNYALLQTVSRTYYSTLNAYTISQNMSEYNRIKATMTTGTYGETTYTGRLYRSGCISRDYGTWNGSSNGHYAMKVYGFTDFLPKNFPHKPVQPIHNHSSQAPRPFVDPDNLATGLGSFDVQPGTWQEYNGLLEWWRLDIKNTGQVGAARYYLSRNIRSSFSNNTYYPNSGVQDNIPILKNGDNPDTGESFLSEDVPYTKSIMTNSHYKGHRQNVVEWIDTEHVIAHDEFGITIMNLITQDYKNFDATTTPALNLGSINQITTLADGTIYIADSQSGLWKLADILGTPIVSQVVCNELNIDDSKCFAVSEGYNNSLWAVFDGGLAHSTDGGNTWSAYTEQNGGWMHYTSLPSEKITVANNNWNTIKMMRVDVSQPDHQIGLVRTSTSLTAELIWWKPTLPAVDIRYLSSTALSVDSQIMSGQFARTNLFKCSRYGGLWILCRFVAATLSGSVSPLAYESGAYLFKHYSSANYSIASGSTSDYPVWCSSTSSTPLKGISFLYDNNKKPYYALQHTASNTSQNEYATFAWLCTDNGYSPIGYASNSEAGIFLTTMQPDTQFAYATGKSPHWHFAFERQITENGYRGPPVSGSGIVSAGGYFSTPTPTIRYYNSNAWRTTTSNIPDNDNWLGRYAPTRDFNWTEFRWNGTNWVANWHQSLTDLTANSHEGIRAGFECESSFFIGKSRIELDDVLSEDFSNGMTLAATIDQTTSRAVGQHKRTVYWATDKFYIGKQDSSSTLNPNKLTIKHADMVHAYYSTASIPDTSSRIVTTISSTPNDSYLFKTDNSIRTERGAFLRPVQNSFIGAIRNSETTGGTYRTLYSPVYSEIDNGDFSIRFELNIPTTSGPGRGVRFGVRYGNRPFIAALDTYNASGVDSYGFRSPEAFCVYFAGGTTAPVIYNGTTNLTFTVNSAITANDQNGTNRLQLRYTISGADLIVEIRRIEAAGSPVDQPLYTCTIAGAGTTYANMPGIIGITPEWTVSTGTSPHQITDFELFDHTTSQIFGKTAYTSTITTYLDGNPTPIDTFSIATDVPLNTPSKLWLGFEPESLIYGLWGQVSNPQVWNNVWDSNDVTTDFSSLTGTSVINTGNSPTSACKARYDMSQTLIETKPTHAAPEIVAGGMEISFSNEGADGIGSFAFINGDFYTWGMFDGILKDNAITMELSKNLHIGCNPDFMFNKLTSVDNLNALTTTIPTITATQATETAVFDTHAFHGPGFIATSTNSGSGANWQRGTVLQTVATGTDGYFEAGVNMRQSMFFGLHTNLDGTSYPANSSSVTGAFIQLNTDGSYSCLVNGSAILAAPAGSYSVDDRFRISRENTATTPTFKFYLNNSQVASSTTGVQTQTMAFVMAGMGTNPTGLHEAIVSYSRNYHSLEVGQWNADSTLASGKFNDRFLMLDEDTSLYDIDINGSPAIILTHNSFRSTLPSSAAIPSGVIYAYLKLGVLVFSDADVGKTITVNKCPVLYM